MIRIITTGVPTSTTLNVTYEIFEKLCKKYCVNNPVQPIVTKTFSIADTNIVGTTLYAKIQAIVNVAYKPKGGCACGFVTNTFIENFTVSFPGADSTSTIGIQNADGTTAAAYLCERNCSVAQGISNTGNITLTLTP